MIRVEASPPEQVAEVDLSAITGMNPQHVLTLRRARRLAGEMSLEDLMALLLYYGSQARWTGVDVLRKVRKMEQAMSNQAVANAAGARTAEQELRNLIRDYQAVLAMEVADARATFNGDSIPLLRLAIDRVEELGQTLVRNAGRIEAAPAAQPLAAAVVDLMATYTKVAGLIEREMLNMRASLRPDVDPAVPQSLHTIAELVETMRAAETDARQALGAGLGQAHGQARGQAPGQAHG